MVFLSIREDLEKTSLTFWTELAEKKIQQWSDDTKRSFDKRRKVVLKILGYSSDIHQKNWDSARKRHMIRDFEELGRIDV